MTLYPNCKINIGLRVVRKREDGYHDLETIFYPIYGLHDTLEVNIAQGDGHFTQEGIAVDCPAEDNLILRCYRMFKEEFEAVKAVDIRFKKTIPFGAGLGGGSSDAAHMAIALNELFGLGLSKAELARRVSKLGADCAFFIYNTPCFAEGIGDKLQEIELDLSRYSILMLKPEVGVSTKDAYAGIHPTGHGIWHDQNGHWDWRSQENDFETTVFTKHPILGQIKQRLINAGATYAAMSGSGSTIFALFENNAEGCANAQRCLADHELAPMVILHDTLAQTKA